MNAPHLQQASARPPVLEINDLVIESSTAQPAIRLLNKVSFSVGAGRTLGLVGESGSGKSLTCLSILGLQPPGVTVRSGSIRLHGQELRTKTARELDAIRGRDIGMILQDPMTSLNPLLTIGEQVGEMFRYRGGISDRKERIARTVEVLRRVRIPAPEARLGSYPHEFSGGMRQRISIAFNIACKPGLLIADEPTTALDVTVRLQVLDLLREIQHEQGSGLLLVTHDLHLVRRYCDDVAVMYAGRVVEQGPVAQVFGQPAHPYTQGLLGAMPRLRGVGRRLAVIPGQPPVPGEIKQGCAFAPRCDRVQADCLEQAPALHAYAGQGHVACHHAIETQPIAAPAWLTWAFAI